MPVEIHQTPNPNALKFAVGVDVGGPQTFVPGSDDLPAPADALLAIPGVASMFMTSDFVTLSKMPDASWDDIAETARGILAAHFSD
ncbi:MAG: scaffolding protein [Acidimicrobiia bacterium]|nr:scaffolding protein [Acidimicrobiia bacterium]